MNILNYELCIQLAVSQLTHVHDGHMYCGHVMSRDVTLLADHNTQAHYSSVEGLIDTFTPRLHLT